jgi:hypothetical protein
MSRVTILPITNASGRVSYHALSGNKQSVGRTAGEALDSLTSQLPEHENSTIVIVQNRRPDQFFDAKKQDRLSELMLIWRAARDKGETLSIAEQQELEALVDAEISASAERSKAIIDQLPS